MSSVVLALLLSSSAIGAPPDPQQLADRIDDHIEAAWKDVQPAPISDDAEFLRRISLDLTGRIPTPRDIHDFLADRDPNKRRKWIDDLLESPRAAAHFANLWRAELLPEAAANREALFFQPGFEAWLRERFRAKVGYDRLVRELLAVPIASNGETPQTVFRDPNSPNALAFFAVKDAQPENLASATTRIFLGIRIECAQCHNHPFASWTQEQFWSQAAFFAGIERQGNGVFAPLSEAPEKHEVVPVNGKKAVSAVFLDDKLPMWKDKTPPRALLAEWITSPTNPYFARATVNRVWGQLFGTGIVDPVDDFHDENAPSHPKLLDELAQALVDSKFDLSYIVKSICLSKAYQRTSRRTHPSQANGRIYANHVVKSMTGEQFYDSLVRVIGFRDTDNRNSPRSALLTKFAPQGVLSEPQTSIPQALSLMNGRFIASATDLERNPTLIAVTSTPNWTTDERIEALYLLALSRKPTPTEAERMRVYVRADVERLADVFWVLLNSAEFRLNH